MNFGKEGTQGLVDDKAATKVFLYHPPLKLDPESGDLHTSGSG
jgi:hypothetical protein